MVSSTTASKQDARLTVTDFQRSFIRFTIDSLIKRPVTVSKPLPFTLNNSRFELESRCRISGPVTGNASREYVLSVSCKTEQVNVGEDIWHDPNADMCLVASPEEFLIIKSWDRNHRGVMLDPPTLGEQPERHVGQVADAFSDLRIDVVPSTARLLANTKEIVDATLENQPLVSQTEYVLEDGTQVWLEYPLKLINASQRETFYQVDTGPILVPDISSYDGRNPISLLRKAFMAHNSLDCTELIVNVPTPIGSGLSVNHYSQVVKLKAHHRIFAID